MNREKILICTGLLLALSNKLVGADKKAAAAQEITTAATTTHLQPPATPTRILAFAAMPPATAACAAAATASTHRSSPVTTNSQPAQTVTNVTIPSQQTTEQWESRNSYKLGAYLANIKRRGHWKMATGNGRTSITSMDFGNTWFDSMGRVYSMMGHPVSNPPRPPKKNKSAPQPAKEPQKTPWYACLCFCSSTDNDVTRYSE